MEKILSGELCIMKLVLSMFSLLLHICRNSVSNIFLNSEFTVKLMNEMENEVNAEKCEVVVIYRL